MIVEKTLKVRLSKEEEECLRKANDIINEIYNDVSDLSCDIEFEDDIENVLDEMQANIRYII